MPDKSLSAQLDDHIAADEEYKVMKQVDREATAAARTDELTWLRRLERSVRDIRATDKYSEQMLCVSEVAGMVNQRIIALLEESTRTVPPHTHYCGLDPDHEGVCAAVVTRALEVGQQELHDMEQAEGTEEFAAGAGFFMDKGGVVWCDRCHAHHLEGTCQ